MKQFLVKFGNAEGYENESMIVYCNKCQIKRKNKEYLICGNVKIRNGYGFNSVEEIK